MSATIQINRLPKGIDFEKKEVDFNVFIERLVEYFEDLEDRNLVNNAMSNNKSCGISLNSLITKYGE